MKVVKYFWGNRAVKSTYTQVIGASGGLAMLCDQNALEVLEILKGRFSLSILCKL